MIKKLSVVPLLLAVLSINSSAKEIKIPEGCQLLRCTCYLPTGNLTADGTVPYEGICASNKEHLGQVAVVYDMNLQIVGYFECRDTGSHEGLKNGSRIDIYRDTEQGITEWQNEIGDYVIVQWVKGEG